MGWLNQVVDHCCITGLNLEAEVNKLYDSHVKNMRKAYIVFFMLFLT
jgi:hypothetical protein